MVKKIRKIVCSEDRKCYIDKVPKNLEMDGQFGGFQDPNELVPFNRSPSPHKRSHSKHGQEGEGRPRSKRSATKPATTRSSSKKPTLQKVKKSDSKAKTIKTKAKGVQKTNKKNNTATTKCCCKVITKSKK